MPAPFSCGSLLIIPLFFRVDQLVDTNKDYEQNTKNGNQAKAEK